MHKLTYQNDNCSSCFPKETTNCSDRFITSLYPTLILIIPDFLTSNCKTNNPLAAQDASHLNMAQSYCCSGLTLLAQFGLLAIHQRQAALSGGVFGPTWQVICWTQELLSDQVNYSGHTNNKHPLKNRAVAFTAPDANSHVRVTVRDSSDEFSSFFFPPNSWKLWMTNFCWQSRGNGLFCPISNCQLRGFVMQVPSAALFRSPLHRAQCHPKE